MGKGSGRKVMIIRKDTWPYISFACHVFEISREVKQVFIHKDSIVAFAQEDVNVPFRYPHGSIKIINERASKERQSRLDGKRTPWRNSEKWVNGTLIECYKDGTVSKYHCLERVERVARKIRESERGNNGAMLP